MTARVGVVSIVQETNTFAPHRSTLDDFESQGILLGGAVGEVLAGTNTEAGGAIDAIATRGGRPVPVLQAWAMSSGPITSDALDGLEAMLRSQLRTAGQLDGLVLSLHGALVDDCGASGDLRLLRAARDEVGNDAVIGVCLDLHANLTPSLERFCDSLVGYLTYPHVDQGETGRRAASLVLSSLEGSARPVTRIAKRPFLVPAEAQGSDGPLGALRETADRLVARGCLDVSLFPVQPWLDVAELGFGVSVTTDSDETAARALADHLAEEAWGRRREFRVSLVDPLDAIERVRRAARRPVVLSESADSPTAGAAADSPAMVRALLSHGRDLEACLSLVDAPAVGACHAVGEGGRFEGELGCSIERRFHAPARLEGVVTRLGGGSFHLNGPAFTGMSVSMGRYAVITTGSLRVLVTERPAPTFDPEAFRVAGIDLDTLDAIVVRSALLFRAAYANLASESVILDLPGASTPRLESLTYLRAPRPMYPLDDDA